jgi:hypothetical protein
LRPNAAHGTNREVWGLSARPSMQGRKGFHPKPIEFGPAAGLGFTATI